MEIERERQEMVKKRSRREKRPVLREMRDNLCKGEG
jgi:hypothetical protein